METLDSASAIDASHGTASTLQSGTPTDVIRTSESSGIDPGPSLPEAAVRPPLDAPRGGQGSLRTAGPREARAWEYFAAQNARHLVSVAGIRTVAQGVASRGLAATVLSNPKVALAAQACLLAWSTGRRALSQWHSERNAAESNAAFSGYGGNNGALQRRLTQGAQTAGIIASDAVALILTATSIARPTMQPIAAKTADIVGRTHLLSQARELMRPLVNTVGVGNPGIAQPPFRDTVTSTDITPGMRIINGSSVALLEFSSRLAMSFVTHGLPLWQVSAGRAVAAAGIAGLANMAASSVEDHLIETAAARRMSEVDKSHVRHIRWPPEVRNPLQLSELRRQLERVDARVFNQMLPAMIAMAIFEGVRHAYPKLDGDPSAGGRGMTVGGAAVAAGIAALVSGLLMGALMPLTARTYQLNDQLRSGTAPAPTPRNEEA